MLARRLATAALLLLAAWQAACSGPEFTITPRALPTPSPTDEPRPTRTVRPPPTPSHTPAPTALYVANTQGQGAILRASPGAGQRVAGLAEGARVVPQGEEQVIEGRQWLRVQDAAGQSGWIASDLLVPTPPPTPGRGGAPPTATRTRNPGSG